METTANEFKKYQDIRIIAKKLVVGIRSKEKEEENVEALVELAGAITANDMSGYATKGDIESLRQYTKKEIESLRQDTKRDIESLRQDTKCEIKDLKIEMYKMHIASMLVMFGFISKMFGKW